MKENCPDFPEELFKKILCRIHKERRFLVIKKSVASLTIVASVSITASVAVFYIQKQDSSSKIANQVKNAPKQENQIAENNYAPQYPYAFNSSRTIFNTSGISIQR